VDLPANTVEYYFSDHLKSTDVVTNATGGIVHESDYVPYGGEVVISGTDPNRYKFTGKERDPESGLDDFDARFYSSPFGRFMTPDWEVKPTDVPYANFGNPQSLNLYSYVQNNPTTVGDPDGHDPNPDIRYKDSQSQQQFERISNESESFRNEVNAAKADHNMDVTVQQVGVQQMPDHAPADATAQRDANGVVHMTINTNPSDDSNAAHELGHVKDARTNTDQFFKDALQDKKDKGGPNEKAHDDPLRSGRTTSGTK
jgi:RHS repeat-associated protein